MSAPAAAPAGADDHKKEDTPAAGKADHAPKSPANGKEKGPGVVTRGANWLLFKALPWPFRKAYNFTRAAISRAIKMPLALVGADTEVVEHPLAGIKHGIGAVRKKLGGVLNYFAEFPERAVDALSIGLTGHPVDKSGGGPDAGHAAPAH